MDDLDRLYIELVEVLRRDRADKLEEPLTIAELHRERVPYQRVREPAGLRSHDDYELALARLLSGERGYVTTPVATPVAPPGALLVRPCNRSVPCFSRLFAVAAPVPETSAAITTSAANRMADIDAS